LALQLSASRGDRLHFDGVCRRAAAECQTVEMVASVPVIQSCLQEGNVMMIYPESPCDFAASRIHTASIIFIDILLDQARARKAGTYDGNVDSVGTVVA
jgi:hypothetical protein